MKAAGQEGEVAWDGDQSWTRPHNGRNNKQEQSKTKEHWKEAGIRGEDSGEMRCWNPRNRLTLQP